MAYIEIKLPKCRLFLTEREMLRLLNQDPDLWMLALKRGKGITRARQARARQRAKGVRVR